ncbi:hypothetical protein SPF06_19460 [Sinomonas sp. JGH33]|uniref:Uncharacterized protein n=1 Tax=Sinomonas terricola TaxID=3110330 RepID=A0ABU5TCV9_9MICC|nr:hypothetical protein [Sinomonas sp. JGH33]
MQSSSPRRMLPSDPCPRTGDSVELRRWGFAARRGVVEDVMPDSSGFWLAADGVEHRMFVSIPDEESQIWI